MKLIEDRAIALLGVTLPGNAAVEFHGVVAQGTLFSQKQARGIVMSNNLLSSSISKHSWYDLHLRCHDNLDTAKYMSEQSFIDAVNFRNTEMF